MRQPAPIFARRPQVSVNGTLQWVQQYGSPDAGDEAGYAIATDSKNNVYTVGSFVTTATFGPVDGQSPTLTSYGNNDGFLVKASPAGSTIWAVQFGGPYNDRAVGVTVDCQDNVIVTGQAFPSANNTVTFGTGKGARKVNTTLDIFVAKVRVPTHASQQDNQHKSHARQESPGRPDGARVLSGVTVPACSLPPRSSIPTARCCG